MQSAEPMQVLLGAAVAEIIDAAVLQEAPDDADDANGLGNAREARAQAASIANDQIDLHPGSAAR